MKYLATFTLPPCNAWTFQVHACSELNSGYPGDSRTEGKLFKSNNFVGNRTDVFVAACQYHSNLVAAYTRWVDICRNCSLWKIWQQENYSDLQTHCRMDTISARRSVLWHLAWLSRPCIRTWGLTTRVLSRQWDISSLWPQDMHLRLRNIF